MLVSFLINKLAQKQLSSYLGRQNSWVSFEKYETEISIKKGSASLSINRTQFPLKLTWAFTVHKVQGLSLEQGAFDFDMQKQKSFGLGQIYSVG